MSPKHYIIIMYIYTRQPHLAPGKKVKIVPVATNGHVGK